MINAMNRLKPWPKAGPPPERRQADLRNLSQSWTCCACGSYRNGVIVHIGAEVYCWPCGRARITVKEKE